MKKQELNLNLKTPYESTDDAWNEYPRPQLKRDSWINLNGKWNLSVRDVTGVDTPVGEVTVPFPPESRLSGISRTLEKGERWVYSRSFALLDSFNSGRILLHFGAVDQIAEVFVNGIRSAAHIGGYLPFSVDITDVLKEGENHLTVVVADDLSLDFPYGKQRRKRGGMWYTPISGIWQTVWMEHVPESYIRDIRITPSLDRVRIEFSGGAEQKYISIPDAGISADFHGDVFETEIRMPHHWSPEDPFLYRFTVSAGEDRVESYFALRTVSVEIRDKMPVICLNGKPFFFHGLLDQGYFSDGIYMPGGPEGFRDDIRNAKKFGFNMLRKHIKVEPDIFYYECDRLGMLVFQDMPNSGRYRYLMDTVLPTFGLKYSLPRRASKTRRCAFESMSREIVHRLYNHPSVVYYTVFNEGWGQYDTTRVYRELKALDPSRVWDAASGWFKGGESDVISEHVYFRKIRLRPHKQRPLVLSEFGGYSCRIDGHCFNNSKNYGYSTCRDVASFTDALKKLYLDEIVPSVRNGLCAAVLTQLSDVEDETNGLLTYDREILKPDQSVMLFIAKTLYSTFRDTHGKK
ncbi:MAG: glycoside hydrolase family 2 [Clostridia bacterium]|nr:glycoside hydrolase family 2 [Clostridia bacterium]